jgi:hypothetical protein
MGKTMSTRLTAHPKLQTWETLRLADGETIEITRDAWKEFLEALEETCESSQTDSYSLKDSGSELPKQTDVGFGLAH